MTTIRSHLTVTRQQRGPIAYDAADYQTEDVELDIEIEGQLHRGQPSVGLAGSYVDEVEAWAYNEATQRREHFDLTDAEVALAEERLLERAEEVV
jgi:hypothetical protein